MEDVKAFGTTALTYLKNFKDAVTAIVFVVLLFAFFCPACRASLGVFFARHYGLKAWAYYEVTTQGELTKHDGRLMLLRNGGRQFNDLVPGDKLMAADGVNLRTRPKSDEGRRIMQLKGDNCVVVLEKGEPKHPPFNDPEVGSGGWLLVGTAPCELFDRPKPFF